MELDSFTYKGVDYVIDSVVELGEKRFQIRTKDHKFFIVRYNEALFKWVICEVDPPSI